MKIWCETCKGKRKITVSDSLGLGFKEKCNCPDCNGNGYIETDGFVDAILGHAYIWAYENGIVTIDPESLVKKFMEASK